ncbi:MAG TPA: hypothetical protein HPQ00_06910, partial [Magnetococcales bacterium]|nr:hypothetical protein [Magnetococcales bacterium]
MSDIHDKNASPPPLCDLYFLDALHALNTAFKENIIRKDGEPDRLQLCYYAGQPIVSEQKNLIHLPVADFLPYFLSDRTRILPERLYLEEGVHPEEQVKEIEKLFYQLIEVIQDHRRGIQKQSLEHCDPICEDLLFEN